MQATSVLLRFSVVVGASMALLVVPAPADASSGGTFAKSSDRSTAGGKRDGPVPDGAAGSSARKTLPRLEPIEILPDDDPAPSPLFRRPAEPFVPPQLAQPAGDAAPILPDFDAPLGFTGPSSVIPSEEPQGGGFVPIEDRWRIGFPNWDRYDAKHPRVNDYPFATGHWWDPYHQNVLKGDYPIIGQHTFLNVSAMNLSVVEIRKFPIGTTPFESTHRSSQEEFFGDPNNLFFTNYTSISFDLLHGDAAFKPADWRIRLTPVFNFNHLDANELAVVNPNVLHGTVRTRSYLALQEWFFEMKLKDTSPFYDFTSVRAGSQFFNSDFRAFIFSDTNRAVRIFGTRNSNRAQFNLIAFDQAEKDTNSELNTFRDRNQNVLIGNFYLQDFIVPGFTAQVSVHYNHDDGNMIFDRNNFLVRPDPAGVFREHTVDVAYLGAATDGHIGRYNISSAVYWALGRDTLDPIANQRVSINAQMGALEISYDRDWVRFKTSGFWASGDNDVNDTQARGFDAIFDNPNFAGGEFSYWQRQAVRLFGVNLVQRQSLLPSLRSSKIQGQSNFVNPGIFIASAGIDMDLTPKLKSLSNVNVLWFDKTNVLETFLFDGNIDRFIGTDVSTGLEYRPLLSNNVRMTFGVAALFPGSGFRDLYNSLTTQVDPMVQGFMDLVMLY